MKASSHFLPFLHGSLVVDIGPVYTGQTTREVPDEFESEFGRFYIIAELYADLWALCIEVDFDKDDHDPEYGCTSLSIAFLPRPDCHPAHTVPQPES